MRLIDADALFKDICDSINEMTKIGIRVDGDWLWAKLNDALENAPTIEPTANSDKYEYHYDHTDCIWYRPEERNRCPSTCAQYRDGWNDAMNYIFRDGKGYRPYRRDKQYEDRKEGVTE